MLSSCLSSAASVLRDGSEHNSAFPKARKIFVRISLVLNIGVLIGVCTVLTATASSDRATYVWGEPTAGRGILLSVYFSLLVVSTLLLGLHVCIPDAAAIEHMVTALLVTQILYKISTPATAGAANPVAISNLCISALHAVTLYVLWRKRSENGRTTMPITIVYWGVKNRALLPQLIASFGQPPILLWQKLVAVRNTSILYCDSNLPASHAKCE
jgi:hypothetical protein